MTWISTTHSGHRNTTERWSRLLTVLWASSHTRTGVLALYYLAILLVLLLLYGSGNFSAPEFVYQGF
ncbi:MAG: teichoic acid D-Ala incorporation-associated protein DltX [Chloroflexi bacterium]|nr:teichoic acid D-Ala incorporation-associated protein DltX [Chloroflexota bacterium]MBV9131604.1 teichoic acid D-Ala incorporation-associated protein DltX [Chloroflexota bacterium]MBV9896515.1 teichoic acid D-Ala incorporation-associated protein DltX [Chloroflexota bacterium]